MTYYVKSMKVTLCMKKKQTIYIIKNIQENEERASYLLNNGVY